jgi:signal transduction histidine kinase
MGTVRWARNLMGRHVRQIDRLVDDLLDLARIMQGKLELLRGPDAIREILYHFDVSPED